MNKAPVLKKISVSLFLIVAVFLIFANLGGTLLWQDEAETALVAKNILKYGIPKAFDGKNLVCVQGGNTFDSNYVWTYTPWVHFYLTAASFAIFGISNFTARLPFALFGFLSIIYFYCFCRFRLKLAFRQSFLCCTIMLFSIPLLLHFRQCRYYAPAVFFTLFFIDSFISFIQNKRGKEVLFILSGLLLFNTSYITFFASLLPCYFYVFVFPGKNVNKKSFIFSNILLFIVILPWALIYRLQQKTEYLNVEIAGNIGRYLSYIGDFALPTVFIFIIIIAFYLVYSKTKSSLVSDIGRFFPAVIKNIPYYQFFAIYVVTFIFVVSFAREPHFRFIIPLFPVLFIIISFFLLELFKKNRAIFFVTLFFYLLSLNYNYKIFNPGYKGKKYWPMCLEYLYELTHNYAGYNGALINFFKANAQETDIILIGYEDLPLMFYSNLQVIGGLHKVGIMEYFGRKELAPYSVKLPDWIVFKGFFEDEEPIIKQIINSAPYKKLELTLPVLNWENREDPYYHNFRSVEETQKIAIYHLAK
jgi:4-amino-4-deoxy-L-arabinose transferase-like glycosyltransferase